MALSLEYRNVYDVFENVQSERNKSTSMTCYIEKLFHYLKKNCVQQKNAGHRLCWNPRVQIFGEKLHGTSSFNDEVQVPFCILSIYSVAKFIIL
jgi:hypothetical protein